MEQVIFGGQFNTLHATNTEYNTLVNGAAWGTIENRLHTLIGTDGIIKNLRVKLSGAPGAGKHFDFTLMVNGAPTALTLEIADAATSGSNMVNEIDVAPGDTVSLQCDPDNTPSTSRATWTTMFEGDTANESLILGRTYSGLLSTATEYGQVMNGVTLLTDTENDNREVVPTSGTIKNLYVQVNGDLGADPDGYRFTLRLNGATVAQSLVVEIIAEDIAGNDLVHNLVVAAGDVLTMMIEPLNTPIAQMAGWGMVFVADIDGESIVMGGSYQALDTASTKYNHLTPYITNIWEAFENRRYELGQVCTFKKLYMLLSAAPGAGNSYTFTLRAAGDTNVVAVVADAATTGNSGVLTDTVANDEYVTLKVVPDDTPDAVDAYWGFVCYIEPVVPPTGAGMGAKPPIMELLLAGVID